jgi:ankyrin repeat protein
LFSLTGAQRNNTGSTPLHLACKNSHASVIVRLLRAGADKNLRDDKVSLLCIFANFERSTQLFRQEII